MATHYRTQGIILKTQDVGEADRVFTVFTKQFGKLRLRAVSERKITSKLRGGLELFYLSDIEFIQGKSHKTITDAALLEPYAVLRGSLERMRLLQRFAEIADELLHGQERDEKVWNLFCETCSVLNRSSLASGQLNVLAYYFLWNLLYLIGYAPPLERIEDRDEDVAKFIGALLKSRGKFLHNIDTRGINEARLRKVSQEHLSRVLQS